MTEPQKGSVHIILTGLSPGFFHHGWCIGADAEADEIARSLGYKIIGHPPKNKSKMADLPKPLIMNEPKEYLDRNKDIAIASGVLIGAPKEFTEQQRSGTWSTIRRGRKHSTYVFIVWPDGSWTID
jgi:hypothetical protein